MIKTMISGCIALACIATSAQAQTLHPTRISPIEAQGAIFSSPAAEKINSPDTPINVTMLQSGDKKMVAGIYQAGASRFEAAPYPIDEFMYFLEGAVKLTSKDGTVTNVSAGDAITIPKGWQGLWETKGYKKYYVIYNPEQIGPAAK